MDAVYMTWLGAVLLSIVCWCMCVCVWVCGCVLLCVLLCVLRVVHDGLPESCLAADALHPKR